MYSLNQLRDAHKMILQKLNHFLKNIVHNLALSYKIILGIIDEATAAFHLTVNIVTIYKTFSS